MLGLGLGLSLDVGRVSDGGTVGQTYNTEVKIDNTKVSGSAALVNFPVSLIESNFTTNASSLFSNCKSDGGDIRVYSDSDGTTQIPHEIASIDTGSSKIEIYIKVPSVSTGADTSIYLRYGDSTLSMQAVDATYGRNAVWSDYDRVYHFNQDPSTTALLDSSGNEDGITVGTWTSGALIDSAFKKGWQFSGSNYITIDGTTALHYDTTTESTYTFGITYNDTAAAGQGIYEKTGGAAATREIELLIYDDSVTFQIASLWKEDADTIPDDTDLILSCRTRDVTGTDTLDIDWSDTGNLASAVTTATTSELGSIGGASGGWEGIFFEARMNNSTELGSDWCKTERENLYNVSTFATAQTPVGL